MTESTPLLSINSKWARLSMIGQVNGMLPGAYASTISCICCPIYILCESTETFILTGGPCCADRVRDNNKRQRGYTIYAIDLFMYYAGLLRPTKNRCNILT